MPRAAPGVIARGALRRKIPGEPRISVQDMGRYRDGYSSWSGSKIRIRPDLRSYQGRNYFTLHLSGFGVEHGRLGEVESLVGDCRPPPPGNPRQPTTLISIDLWNGGLRKNPFIHNGFNVFIPKWRKKGEVFLPMYKHLSFNNSKYLYNLKKSNRWQYFKNNCSYFSCIEKCTVLEFVNSHYHLYGVWLVRPPSIAITNVLIT
jgi:hypothetical protein